MLTRRRFLDLGRGSLLAALAIRPGGATARSWLNDVHSGLNLTSVQSLHHPGSLEQLQAIVRDAGRARRALSIAGARHAMGGQQFLTDGCVVDMAAMNRALAFDARAGLVECEAGIQWPELMDHLERAQAGQWPQWGITQKQTGADRLSLGGALAANVHGRGLAMRPFIDDVASFVLIDAAGEARRCSRTENADLFRLAIGGYGLFGAIATVTLKLSRRRKLERVVEIIGADELMAAFERRIAAGFLYGDFQFSTDESSPSSIAACSRAIGPWRTTCRFRMPSRNSARRTGRSSSTTATPIAGAPTSCTPGTTCPPRGRSTGRTVISAALISTAIIGSSTGAWGRDTPARR
jgi:FAD/FMN-containing dehydrogenase